jgi:hypothetical protein
LKKVIQSLILLSLLVCSGGICWAISITVTGDWSEIIDSGDLQGGAGSNLKSSYESVDGAISIDIAETGGDWWVNVKKIDTKWHSNLHLYVQRTTDGTGLGSIAGDLKVYQEVTNSDQGFFSGSLDRSGINIQLKLIGVSIQVPPDSYETTVWYTVSDPY